MARPKNNYRPGEQAADPDWEALFCMYVLIEMQGLPIIERARRVVHMVPKVGTVDSRLQRLCRKYAKMAKSKG